MKSLRWLTNLAVYILLIAAIQTPRNSGQATIRSKSDRMATDHLQNLYAISGNTITKYNTQGSMLSQYTWSGFDAIDCADPSDPFKILIFNQSSGSVMRLDNQLFPLSEPFSLASVEMFSPKAICNSWDNGMWVYDHSMHELLRVNTFGIIDQRSGSLENLFPAGTTIGQIRELDFSLYMAVPESGVYIFDRFANLIRQAPIKGIETFQVTKNMIRFPQDSIFIAFNLQTLQYSSLSLPGVHVADAQQQGNSLFIRYQDSIMIQTVIQPK